MSSLETMGIRNKPEIRRREQQPRLRELSRLTFEEPSVLASTLRELRADDTSDFNSAL